MVWIDLTLCFVSKCMYRAPLSFCACRLQQPRFVHPSFTQKHTIEGDKNTKLAAFERRSCTCKRTILVSTINCCWHTRYPGLVQCFTVCSHTTAAVSSSSTMRLVSKPQDHSLDVRCRDHSNCKTMPLNIYVESSGFVVLVTTPLFSRPSWSHIAFYLAAPRHGFTRSSCCSSHA